MGLFWSMSQSPGQRSGLRLAKKDVTTPLTVNLSVYDGHLSVDELHGTHTLCPLANQTVYRWYLGRNVIRSEVHHGNIRGTLFTPPGESEAESCVECMFGGQ